MHFKVDDVRIREIKELLKRDILVDYRPKAGVRMSPHFYQRSGARHRHRSRRRDSA